MMIQDDFYVVGIGASAGGLDAVQQLFDNIPDKPGMAFIIVQHLSPDFKSLMPELLSKHTKMKILIAEEGKEIKPNCIYLNQQGKNLALKGNKLILLEKPSKDMLNLPIDVFFSSMGQNYKDKSIGIILSGTGTDGSRGIKSIKEEGGTILVQDPDSAQFNGMPNAAILTKLVDFVLQPYGIAKKLIQFTENKLDISPDSAGNETIGQFYQKILSEIQKFSGVNFKKYKNNTLLRRIEKRMSLHNIQTLENYYQFLTASQKECEALNQEFLIGVTSFFRDPEAFQILRDNVIQIIFENKKPSDLVRVWVAGCSTGEEVYSLAILLEEYVRSNKLTINYKVFATDVDKRAIQFASQGYYPINNIAEIDNHYLKEYFIKSGNHIQISKTIRDKIIFSYHDITNNPPFINMDLISCRNMLIYLTHKTQQSVLRNFQYALNLNGFLFLGSSESIGEVGSEFKTINAKWKIYQNQKVTARNLTSNLFGNFSPEKKNQMLKHTYSPQDSKKTNTKLNELYYYKFLTRKHSPVSVFIDKEFNVQFIAGDFRNWFRQKDGIFSNNILNMVDAELSTVIRNGIRRLIEKGKQVVIKNLVSGEDNRPDTTQLIFDQVTDHDSEENLYLIQFKLQDSSQEKESIVLTQDDFSSMSKQRIEDLEYELKETRARLQIVVEELEASNEELQSSNEELMSSNEELQSSNEELQSVNEELHTVNTEFQEKNRELENLNNDIINLLNSTDIGTLFLDTNLNIRKFTPSIKRIFNLEDSDIGRSISSFASEFEDETRKSIISHSQLSLDKLKTFEREVQDANGNWYLKRISPFITAEKKIEGVVITFVDINSLKKTRTELNETEMRLSTALEAGSMAWWELELPSKKIVFSENKTKMLGYQMDAFPQFSDFMNLVHPEDYERTMNEFNNHLLGKTERYDCIYRIKNNNGQYQWFQDVGKIVFKNLDRTIISGVSLEMTQKKQIEIQLREAKQKAETANIYKNQFLANISHEIRTPMNGLVGFSSLLRKDNIDKKTRETYVDIVESSSKQLLNLIDDIINVSKIETGEFQLEKSCCNLGDLLFEIETTFKELKKRRKKERLELKTVIPEHLKGLTTNTDKDRLQQILNNIVGNAIKFTDIGSVEFGYTLENNKIIFTVKDTGIGIPFHSRELIFERFQKLMQKDVAKYDGTGLGLTLSKGLIELMGGKISVDSQEGAGTIFTFDIPYEPCFIATEVEERNSKKLIGKTILIAEDDHFNNLYLKEMFQELPVEVIWAENGQEAVELYKANPDISLILMDIRMPVMNGIEAAQEIQTFNPAIKIIAQTAFTMANDREKYIENGFVDFIPKPIQKEELFDMILKWIDN